MLDALRQLFRDHPIAAPAGTAVALLGAERLLRPAGCGSGTPGLLLTAGGVVAAGVAGIRLGAMAAGAVADSPGEMLRGNPAMGRDEAWGALEDQLTRAGIAKSTGKITPGQYQRVWNRFVQADGLIKDGRYDDAWRATDRAREELDARHVPQLPPLPSAHEYAPYGHR
jgi:hypothetical protein